MCIEIYISSKRELPTIPWNQESPGFYVCKVKNQGVLSMLKPIFNTEFVYEALSHMGCSCGLSYQALYREDKNENFVQRQQDVENFANYLDTHKQENNLQIFSSEWNTFLDIYPQKEFRISEMSQTEFEIEELVIPNVV